jgi:RNA polymerase sigma-B factor
MSAATAERSTLSVDRELAGLPLRERTARLLEAAAAAGSDEERAAFQGQAVEINMATAAQLAARYRARGISEDDLRQVAYLALVKAVQRYEYAPDRDFMSFAIPTVRGELRRYFRDLGWTIRPTRRVHEAQAAIQRSEGQLCQ